MKSKDTYQCPYCGYSCNSYVEIHDHLTYYEWMSVPAVEKVIREITLKKEGEK